jgi:hypothetical protein
MLFLGKDYANKKEDLSWSNGYDCREERQTIVC